MDDSAPDVITGDFTLTDVTLIADGLRFPEGPLLLPDGRLAFVEIARSRLAAVTPDGTGGWGPVKTVAEIAGGPNGAALGPDGAVYICNNGGCFSWIDRFGMTFPGPLPDTWTGGSIDRVDLLTGAVTTLYSECNGHGLRAPNDIVFDAHGGFWFTDHGVRMERTSDRTGIYYAKADGSHIAEVVFPVDAPNGIGLSPSGNRVYWAETHTGRLFYRDITAPGEVSIPTAADRGCLAGLPGMQLLDSLAVDGNGNVCVATIVRGGITLVSPTGVVSHASLGEEFYDVLTTNICFGGADLRTAYITLSGTGRLVSARWPHPGLALNY